MAIKLEYIDNVFIRTNNPKGMNEFYTQAFALPTVYADGCVERLQVGTIAERAMLAFIDNSHVVGDQMSLIGFNVVDIVAAYKEATSLGLKADTYIRTFGPNNQYKYFNVVDPDGNIVTLVQPN